jgi:hypothetical protein
MIMWRAVVAVYRSFGVALGDLDGDGDIDAFVVNSERAANKVWLG